MENLPELLQKAIEAMSIVEIVSVITGIIYVILAARENVWCWAFGIVSAALWSYAAYMYFGLYVDAILQFYYIFVGFYGWYEWNKTKGNTEQKELKISQLSIQQHFIYITSGLALSFIVGYLFDEYTAAVSTYLDAFTTVFAIFTTYLVTRKVLENWLYWIVIDMVYVYLYYSREGYLFALLNIVFVIVAIVGYSNWRKKL